MWRVIYSFLSINRYNLMAQYCGESGDTGSTTAGCWNSLTPLCHFEWHWARQCTGTRVFILHTLQFFVLRFRQRRFRADRVSAWDPWMSKNTWKSMANTERFQPSPPDCFGSSDNHSLILFQKIKEGFDCKVNVQTFRAALRQSLGGSYGQRGDHKHRVFSSRGSSCWQFLIGL